VSGLQANQERDDQCGKQRRSRELLMMGIVMLETCSAYKTKYNKISSGIYLDFLFFSYHNDARSNKHQKCACIVGCSSELSQEY